MYFTGKEPQAQKINFIEITQLWVGGSEIQTQHWGICVDATIETILWII
jgi:hypothetical protein